MTTKLTFGLILCLGVATSAIAQQGRVGINTTNPAATFDVVAKNADPAVVDGVIAPRLTGDELKAKDAVYLAPQTGALVYATSAVTTPSGTKTANVTSAGYYYFDGAVWVKVASPVASADNTDDEWINNTANTRIELGRTSTKAARPAGTEFAALDNGFVGIGTATPTSKLSVIGGTTGNTFGLTLANTVADATVKFGYIQAPAYSNANPNMLGISMITTQTSNSLSLGGGNSFTLSTPTNISFFTDDDTNLSTIGGTERMIITQPGNVGIGTTTPSNKLEVKSGVANTSGVRFTNLKSTSPVTAGATTLGVDANGDVVTVDNTFTTTNGTVELSPSFALNSGDVKHNAIKFTLPSAGTYLVSYTIRALFSAPTAINAIVTASIITQGTAAGTVVGLSEINVARYPPGMGNAAGILGGNGTGTVILTTTGPIDYYVRVANTGGTDASINSSGTGRSTVTYVKISN